MVNVARCTMTDVTGKTGNVYVLGGGSCGEIKYFELLLPGDDMVENAWNRVAMTEG